MDLSRRGFLGGGLAAAANGLAHGAAPRYFDLHPFIRASPKAVFVRRTNVAGRLDFAGMRREGLHLGRSIFEARIDGGIPLTHRVVLKPNVLTTREQGQRVNWGTDADFYGGLLTALHETGLRRFHYVEANYRSSRWSEKYDNIHDQFGVDVLEPQRRAAHYRRDEGMNWAKPDDGVVYARVPHYPPIHEPDTWLFNIAKWRSHGMCLTQACKNAQGLAVWPFQRFCPGWAMVTGAPDHMKPFIANDVVDRVTRYLENHKKMNYGRYASGAELSPVHQEIWAHKTCDHLSTLKFGLHMVEAIYAKNEDPADPVREFLPNFVMFAKDPFRLDLVGLWLGGHEPGNVHFYRIAKERGLSDTFNPWDVDVYEWTDTGPVKRKLSDFPRTMLKTYYLQKEGEPLYHMVDEPFDYDRYKL